MSLENVILDLMENARKSYPSSMVLNLGGASGPGGGVGGPPAGFTGKLPQTRIAYDETELESSDTPPSGESLVTNLNHIRASIAVIENQMTSLSIPEGTPLTSSSSGDEGAILRDTDYIYVCVTQDTWKRAGLSSW